MHKLVAAVGLAIALLATTSVSQAAQSKHKCPANEVWKYGCTQAERSEQSESSNRRDTGHPHYNKCLRHGYACFLPNVP